MIMDEPDRQHALSIISWFSERFFNKYQRGVAEHKTYLPEIGGVLNEAENEALDLPAYLRTLRMQLERVERWIEQGQTENALIAVGLILRGSKYDKLPEG